MCRGTIGVFSGISSDMESAEEGSAEQALNAKGLGGGMGRWVPTKQDAYLTRRKPPSRRKPAPPFGLPFQNGLNAAAVEGTAQQDSDLIIHRTQLTRESPTPLLDLYATKKCGGPLGSREGQRNKGNEVNSEARVRRNGTHKARIAGPRSTPCYSSALMYFPRIRNDRCDMEL